MFTRAFFVDLVERVISTTAEVALGTLTAGLLFTLKGAAIVGTAALATVFKGLVAAKVGDKGTAALVSPA